ncbi:MAG: LysM peptidoglycan-binding domain-containing protein, partial [Proteobacteria bacterium]|nr:LysM peptidoglycan-binding domain-containing protein [Pseudomonadota bacterium]
MNARLLAVATLVSLAAARSAHADDGVITYRARPGDTYELLAAEFYQDRRDAVYLLEANGLKHPKKIIPGERLKIPMARNVVSSKGDTFESLAAQLLGDARRGAYLAEFNNRSPDETLPAGTPISVPFTVTHVAESPETLGQLSAAYFGNSKQADMLRGYNFLDHDTLAKGESLVVPIYHVKPKASKLATLDAEARKRSEDRARTVERAASSLPAARAAWRAGEFATVRNELRSIDVQFLETAVAVEVGVLRGAADVAFGLDADAQGEFEAVLA